MQFPSAIDLRVQIYTFLYRYVRAHWSPSVLEFAIPDSDFFSQTHRNCVSRKKMVDKWSIKPTLAEKLVDILAFVADKEEFTTETIVRQFGFTPTTTKRYLRQLTEFGYLESHGGNRNRTHQFMQTGNS